MNQISALYLGLIQCHSFGVITKAVTCFVSQRAIFKKSYIKYKHQYNYAVTIHVLTVKENQKMSDVLSTSTKGKR